jgi:acyl-CoA reductase-like NAD-dependent aldehyde dehydrogenase
MKTYQMFIGGQWVEAVSGSTFDDFDSYSGEIYTKVAEGDAQDADRAMAAAFTARKE